MKSAWTEETRMDRKLYLELLRNINRCRMKSTCWPYLTKETSNCTLLFKCINGICETDRQTERERERRKSNVITSSNIRRTKEDFLFKLLKNQTFFSHDLVVPGIFVASIMLLPTYLDNAYWEALRH